MTDVSNRKSSGQRKFQTRARKDDDKALVREHFLKAATEQFATHSFDAVSMRSVAKAAGYSQGTIYKYFPSKRSLYLCVKENTFIGVVAKLQKIGDDGGEPDQRLFNVALAYVDFWIANADQFKAMFSMSGTVADRTMPDGTFFGESEVAVRTFGLFSSLVQEFFDAQGAALNPQLNNTLTATLLSACHGAISFPLGAMTMKLPDSSLMAQMLLDAIIKAWTSDIEAAKSGPNWPALKKSDFR